MASQAKRVGLFVLGALALAATTAPAAQAQVGCTITWDAGAGTDRWFEVVDPTPAPDDEIYNWAPERYPTNTDHACFPAGAIATTDQVTTNTPDVGSFALSAGASLSVTDVQLIVRENSLNAGTLNMSGAVPITISDGDPADHEGLTNTGTIHFTSGGTGLRAIVGDLTNQGTIDVDHPEASIQQSGAGAPANSLQTNQGTIDISPGSALRSIFSNFVNGSGGVITGGGSMNMDQNRFEAAGGSQIAAGTDVNMTNSVFAGATGSTATGNVDIVGAFSGGGPSVLEGTVPAGITLDVEPGVTLQSPAVETTVNAGRININGSGSQLQVLPNDATNSTSRLTNAPSGTIEFTADNPAATGVRFITGRLQNQGALLVNDPEASFQAPGGTSTRPKLTNTGTFTISADNALRAIESAVVLNGVGGSINGAGAVNHGEGGRLELRGDSQIAAPLDYNLTGDAGLDLTAASAASGNVEIVGSTSPLTGDVPQGISIDVRNATLRSLTSFSNAGTITLDRTTGDFAEPTLSTEDGDGATTETLTNTGTITVTGNLGTPRIAGDLVNQGTLSVSNPFVLFEDLNESRPPKLTNTVAGTLTVAAGSTFALVPGETQNLENAGAVQVNGSLNPIGYTQTGGTTTLAAGSAINLSPPTGMALQGGTLRGTGSITGGDVNNTGGTLAPGTSPGTLTLSDDYTQGAGGTLAVEVQGATPGTGYDRLVVGGTAALGGTLNITTVGFTPATGQLFEIVDAPAVSGGFASVQQSGGPTYSVAVNATDITLTAQAPPQPPPPDGDGDGVPDASDNCPTQAGPASNGGCPIVLPPPDKSCEKAEDKLEQAKKKLKKLKQDDASKRAIEKAKAKVKKAKQDVKEACAV